MAATSGRRRNVPVRVPEAIAVELQREADARGVGRDWMAGRLLAEALENLRPAEEFSLVRRHKPAVERPEPPPERPSSGKVEAGI